MNQKLQKIMGASTSNQSFPQADDYPGYSYQYYREQTRNACINELIRQRRSYKVLYEDDISEEAALKICNEICEEAKKCGWKAEVDNGRGTVTLKINPGKVATVPTPGDLNI